MLRNKDFRIGDLFTPLRGKGLYTRAYSDKNPGTYPVYSASLSAPLCLIKTHDYEGAYLTWTTNGYGGRMQVITGKFSINGDRGILIPKYPELPSLEYLQHILEPQLISKAVGRVVDGKKNEYTKVSPEIVSECIISLPIKSNGDFDLAEIKIIANKILRISHLQNSLKERLDDINSAEILIECEKPYKILSISDENYFSLSIGKRVVKKFTQSSGVPVYSANVNIPFAHIKKSNLNSFDDDSLIWGIDGNFSWNRIPKNIEFANTDHCGRMQIISNLLDSEYVFHMLQSTRLEHGFDRVFRANLENLKKQIFIKIPLNARGDICLKRQKLLAAKFRKLSSLKNDVCESLELLLKIKAGLG